MSEVSDHSALEEKISNLPLSPGVYIYRDDAESILYVGKAKKLRNRVRSYFQESRPVDGRIKTMVSKIDDLEVIVTDTEAEALILENNLIKQYQPRYNIMYRDDKSYPYICITDANKPRVYPTRTVLKDGSKYFGPYDSVGTMKRMLETIRKAFGLCTCAVSQKVIDKTRGAPKWHSCFDDYLQNCSGDWDDDLYQDTIKKVERLLNGQTDTLIRELKEEMQIASEALAFEEAANLRDSIQSVERYSQKMKIVASKKVDRDVFAIGKDDDLNEACGVLFKIREGKLIGKFHRYMKNIEGLSHSDMIQSFVEDYYTGQYTAAIPDEVYLSHEMTDSEALEQYLYQERAKIVPVHVPQIGEKKQLIKMAEANVRLYLREREIEKEKAERDRIPQAVKDLKEHLKLQRLPRRLECFDNSNFQGSDPVASMVCFVDARPRKSEYKKFHIKTVEGPDDFASMREILRRRYTKVQKDKLQIPDLIIVDGGKGQLSAAVETLKDIGFYGQCDVIGLAKRLEEVFLPGMSDSIMIPKKSPALKLLQQARDEAHRFAITFHRSKRAKRTFTTELTDIEGIGKKTADRLLREFGSVKKVKQAELEELKAFLGEKTGENVFNYFHS
ncbi:excinuclease ABC subunit UvrC [Balneola sp. MJW-20]|uniref:excinuclease ABC subunit UvrC n=1 Tax=Gracilimonas aurantiaca TaxID=3234185 RepID=UPI0034654FB6